MSAALSLDIIYRDQHLLVVNKPSGLPVHKGWSDASVTIVDLVRDILQREDVHPAHRLDQGTSGVLVFAIDVETARALRLMFDAHALRKRYIALVRGKAPGWGFLDYAIPAKPDGPRVPAQSALRRLATRKLKPRTLSLVEVEPLSGRLHQIRRHLKHLSYPVINDANYGDTHLNRAVTENYGLERLALHAYGLRMKDPYSDKILDLVAPWPPDLLVGWRSMDFASALTMDFAAMLDDNWSEDAARLLPTLES